MSQKVYQIEQHVKDPNPRNPTWRQVCKKIGRCVKAGACERWIKYKNLPYMKEVPPTMNFPRKVLKDGTMLAHVGVVKSYITSTATEDADALKAADMILYTVDPDMEITAFALLRFSGADMEITVICSREGVSGKPLVLRALEIAREKKKRYAKLHALRHVLDYYTRFGFQRRGVWGMGNNVDGWPMEKNLSSRLNWTLEPSKKSVPPPTPEPVTTTSPKSLKRPRMTDSTPKPFSVNSLVWAKLGSHKPWPARVIEPHASHLKNKHEPNNIPVGFFGESSFAWVHPSRLTPYAPGNDRPERRSKNKALLQAIRHANAI